MRIVPARITRGFALGFIALALCASILNEGHALFDTTQLSGARPLALGGSYAAISDDAEAIKTNPAGLTQLPQSEITLTYNNLYGASNLSDNEIGFAIPWHLNTFGISYQRLALADIFNEENITVSFARTLRRNLSLGVNLKLLRATIGNFSVADVSAQTNATELSTDIGLWSAPVEQVALGLVVYDVNAPRFQFLSGSPGETIQPAVRAGIAYRPKKFILFDMDYHTVDGALKDPGESYHLGSELTFADVIILRLGVDRSKFTGGIGLTRRWMDLDFAFYNQGELGLTYRVSVSFRWQ